jgi:hypothetical protein
LSNCVVSSETINHTQDTSQCQIVNNDATKKYKLHFKTYIEDIHNGNNRIEIADCKPQSVEQNYSTVGSVWKVVSSSTQNIRVNNLNNGLLLGKWIKFEGNIKYNRSPPYCNGSGWFGSCFYEWLTPAILSGMNLTSSCLNPAITPYWLTSAGNWIDTSNSDGSVSYAANYVESAPYFDHSITHRSRNGLQEAYQQKNYTLSCTNPTCLLTTLFKYPKYRRGNGTEYTDQNTVTDQRNVCGSGSMLSN